MGGRLECRVKLPFSLALGPYSKKEEHRDFLGGLEAQTVFLYCLVSCPPPVLLSTFLHVPLEHAKERRQCKCGL